MELGWHHLESNTSELVITVYAGDGETTSIVDSFYLLVTLDNGPFTSTIDGLHRPELELT